MDVEVGTFRLEEGKALCNGSLKSNPEANGTVILGGSTNPDANAQLNNKANSLGPITPAPNREKGDNPVDSESPRSPASPPSVTVKYFQPPIIVKSYDVGVNDSAAAADDEDCTTPKQVVFDPFAPGPDHMALAPICNKVKSKSQVVRVRRLSFDGADEKVCNGHVKSLSEEMLLESVYNNLLEVIVSKQAEDSLAENVHSRCLGDINDGPMTPTSSSPLVEVIVSKQAEYFLGGNGYSRRLGDNNEDFLAENGHTRWVGDNDEDFFLAENGLSSCSGDDTDDGPKTPTSSPPLLSLIAETCPGAPMKTMPKKPRNIEPGLCKKLEF